MQSSFYNSNMGWGGIKQGRIGEQKREREGAWKRGGEHSALEVFKRWPPILIAKLWGFWWKSSSASYQIFRTKPVCERCCGWICVKRLHSGQIIGFNYKSFFLQQQQQQQPWDSLTHFPEISSPLYLTGQRSCTGSYVTLVSSTLCQSCLVVPVSYCSIRDRIRERLPPFLTVWRSPLSRWLRNLFLVVAPQCSLGTSFSFD